MTKDSSAGEKKRLMLSMLIPFMLVFLMWLMTGASLLFGNEFHFLGIYPGRVSSLTGIITSPFVHSGFRQVRWGEIRSGGVSYGLVWSGRHGRTSLGFIGCGSVWQARWDGVR